MHQLTVLAQGVFAWLQETPRLGVPNAGVVLDVDGATVIDTLAVASQYEPFGDAVDALGFRVRRIVLTGDHLDFVGGTVRFPMAAVYGSPSASAHLDQPADPAILRALHPDLAAEIDDELRTRSVTHVVAEATDLTPATVVVPLDGQSALNLAVLVPEADVLFGGALCCFGVTPLAFDGDPAAWAESLDALAPLATTIVPGHGRIGGEAELRDQQAYLRACADAAGDPQRIPAGPWDQWPGRAWDAV
ncbi:MAG: Zn-dependent hydrolase, glyoxylase, partial [Acidimicrobiales bacterium]|nr:Zn-dependent hydrolase, glyoxylase [Acidimicrobiales bacterium]